MKNWFNETDVNAAVASIKRVVDIPSVLDEDTTGIGFPFGKSVVAALDETLAIAKELGFTTYRDPEGYYGYAEIGTGSEVFGIIGHLDVVPSGDEKQWDHAPFDMQVVDGVMIGRGTQDDKGPTIATMYVVKAMLDAGAKFKGRVRFIYGTDEENLWRCMERYTAKEEGIDMGFVPDAEFPLTYAEKGLLDFDLLGPGLSEIMLSVGGAYNAVPDGAQVTLSTEQTTKLAQVLDDLDYPYTLDGTTITVQGKSAHAKDALDGVNAVTRLGHGLLALYPELNIFKFLTAVDQAIEAKTTILGEISDPESGKLTLNLAKVEIAPEQTRIAMNIRIPVTVAKDAVVSQLQEFIAPFALQYSEIDYLAPLYIDRNSAMVQTMIDVYREISGDTEAEPMVSGGATFARTIKNSVAFGAMFPDTPDYMHQPNERWAIKDMTKMMEIYAEVLNRLFVEK